MNPGSARRTGVFLRVHRHKRLLLFVAGCLFVLAVSAAISLGLVAGDGTASALRLEIVELNEWAQTASTPEEVRAIARAQEALRDAARTGETRAVQAVGLLFAVALGCMVGLAAYLYRAIALPFEKLQGFAEEVASGNLDVPLAYERSNPFGKFAWAFDHMRCELKRARKAELAAIEENKAVLASLAHDLRTPVASIRTYAEALEMGLERSEEERRGYVQVIGRRCLEVSRLVDDMLTHALAELDRIEVACSAVSVAPLVRQIVGDFGLGGVVVPEVDEALVWADELRLRQALENLLVNAAKYAPGAAVEVTGRRLDEERYRIEVRDFGPGMPASDIPFAFNRFYRGSNAGSEPGSGLGLYVVRYVIERMGGEVALVNARPGVAVRLDVPLTAGLLPSGCDGRWP